MIYYLFYWQCNWCPLSLFLALILYRSARYWRLVMLYLRGIVTEFIIPNINLWQLILLNNLKFLWHLLLYQRHIPGHLWWRDRGSLDDLRLHGELLPVIRLRLIPVPVVLAGSLSRHPGVRRCDTHHSILILGHVLGAHIDPTLVTLRLVGDQDLILSHLRLLCNGAARRHSSCVACPLVNRYA